MKKADINFPKLTKNEQSVLKKIIEQSKIHDAEIAKKMGISQQAVYKIRHKLEQVGIIKGYEPIIDFKKVGVEFLVVIGIRFTDAVWEKYSEEQLAENIRKIPQVVICYRTPESKLSHLLVMGFKSIDQKDRYLMRIQSKFQNEIVIVHINSFSVDRILKASNIGLLGQMIDSDDSIPKDFFPR